MFKNKMNVINFAIGKLGETGEGAFKHLLKLVRRHLYRSLFFNEVTR